MVRAVNPAAKNCPSASRSGDDAARALSGENDVTTRMRGGTPGRSGCSAWISTAPVRRSVSALMTSDPPDGRLHTAGGWRRRPIGANRTGRRNRLSITATVHPRGCARAPCSLSAGEDAGWAESGRLLSSTAVSGSAATSSGALCSRSQGAAPLREDELRRTAPIGRDCIRGDQGDHCASSDIAIDGRLFPRLERDRHIYPERSARADERQPRSQQRRPGCRRMDKEERRVAHAAGHPSPSSDATYLATCQRSSSSPAP